MDKELIERLALQAGELLDEGTVQASMHGGLIIDLSATASLFVQHFAALIGEECAKVCDELAAKYDASIDPVESLNCEECATAIRDKFST